MKNKKFIFISTLAFIILLSTLSFYKAYTHYRIKTQTPTVKTETITSKPPVNDKVEEVVKPKDDIIKKETKTTENKNNNKPAAKVNKTSAENKITKPAENKDNNISTQTPPEASKPEQSQDAPKQKKKKYNLKNFTSEAEILEALKLLQENGEEEVLRNIYKYAMQVKFDDFDSIYYKKEGYFGMTAYNKYGTKLILVNSMYKNAPSEQIACIIAHESMHTRIAPTIEEENLATKKEAQCWKNLKSYSKSYPETKLTSRLNKLIESSDKDIEQRIAKSHIYKELK